MTQNERIEQTMDIDRLHRLISERRKVLDENIRLAVMNGDGRRADELRTRAEECDNAERMFFMCLEPKAYSWRVIVRGARVATLPGDATVDDLMEACDRLCPEWRDLALEWICGRYDNPDEARDALWDILTTEKPHAMLMAQVMDDVKGLRLHENETAEMDDRPLFIQYKEVMA